jgi:ESCRT-II complex subunit VPS25
VWLDLIRSYCAHHRLYRLALHAYNSASGGTGTQRPAASTRDAQLVQGLFRNSAIDRQLSLDAIRMLLDALAADSYGLWEDVGPNRSMFLLSPAHRFTEIGDQVWAHVERIGEQASIVTLYELQHGDAMKGAPFYGMDEHILLAALKTLEARGKCTLIPSGVISETGVKFLG